MRYIVKSILPLMVILLCAHFVYAKDRNEPRLITVSGNGEVSVVPDKVVFTLGVETWDKDLSIAKKENDIRTGKIIDIAKRYKIGEKDIQTDYIRVEPRYKHGYEHREFIGYVVQKTIVITLRDTSRFEGLLSDVLEAGANYLHGVQFRTTELRKYKAQARSLAINNALEKAKTMANELGQNVGKPFKIQEEPSGWWSWYNSFRGAQWREGMAQAAMQIPGGSPVSGSSIALGQIKVNARVTVSFELE